MLRCTVRCLHGFEQQAGRTLDVVHGGGSPAVGNCWAWARRFGGLFGQPAGLCGLAKKWGREAPPRMAVWQRLVRDNKAAGATATRVESVSRRQVNGIFNQVPYRTDQQHWGAEDYWATPTEMLGSFGGDCEDYSISKYLSLKEIGVPVEKLRITYVRALKLGESHMVLAY